MAISWGAWEYSGGNGMRVGIEIEGWTEGDGSGPVVHGSAQAQTWVGYYTENQYSYSDGQTLSLSGAIDATVNFTNNQGGAVTQRARRLYEYNYGANEYGSSPGSRTFTAKLSGAFNGVTPSKSVTSKIPARPYWAPEKPTNASVSRVSDSSQKVTWKNNATSGKPYDRLQVDRWDTYTGSWKFVASPGGSATSYTDSTTYPNEGYEYRVRAENSEGNSSWEWAGAIQTTPDSPSHVTRTGANGADQVVTWNNNVGYPGYTTQVWHAADGVWDSTPLAEVAEGVTSYTHPAPDPAKAHKYRLRAKRVTTGATLYSVYSTETTETTGATSTPDPATNLAPSGTTIIPTQVQRFSWTFNSTDGSVQRFYRIRHRQAGTSTWTTEADVYTANTYWDAPANKFANDATYEWQVATWGADETGRWSGTATFYTASDPAQIRQNKRPVILNTDTGEMETAGRGVLPPVGSLMPYAGNTAPAGWLLCQGQEVSQTTYADLYAVIGTKFGTAAAGMFRLPDLRDRVAVGASTSKAAGTSGGSSTKTIAVGNLPPHNHGIDHDHGTVSGDGSHNHTHNWRESANSFGPQDNIAAAGGTGGTVVNKRVGTAGDGKHAHNVPAFSGTSGGGAAQGLNGEALDVQNPYVAMHHIIKV